MRWEGICVYGGGEGLSVEVCGVWAVERVLVGADEA